MKLLCWVLGHQWTEAEWKWWEPFITWKYCGRCRRWLKFGG